MERLNQRQGFLVSAIVHLSLLMVVLRHVATAPKEPEPKPRQEAAQRIFLPPKAMLRQLIPALPPRAAAPVPAPRPTPEPKGKDRISIGPPSAPNDKPLILHKDDDITKVAKGLPKPPEPSAPPATLPPETARAAGRPDVPGSPGLRMPPGLGDVPHGAEGSRGRPGSQGPSIASSLRGLDRKLAENAPLGIPTGTGGQYFDGFKFDPEGADFTAWVQHLKSEVYRNWILPQPALLGIRGHCDISFTVERDGTVSNVQLLKSAGTPALDRAAENALRGSHPLPLPADYAPRQLTIEVSFFYNEAPQGS